MAKSGDRNGRKPVSLRAGRIQVSIWTNTTNDGKVWYSVTGCRTYKDQKGQWQNANSYGIEDLLVLSEMLKSAWGKILELRAKSPEAEQQENGTPSSTTVSDMPF